MKKVQCKICGQVGWTASPRHSYCLNCRGGYFTNSSNEINRQKNFDSFQTYLKRYEETGRAAY